jgi:GNAT superfamily N-acetyltransferase
MLIVYAVEPDLSAREFRDILVASTLSERRPVGDLERLDRMLRHADIIVTARDGDRLAGISRAITDFAYCCYLSDLAVDAVYQRRGIGKRLIEETRKRAGECATLILISAPTAETYYPKIGMLRHPGCWTIPRTS